MQHPLVTVVMPAYRTEESFFEDSVNSILNQTYENLEFIIIDDGLSNENRQYLATLHDERITIIVNESNIGQSKSSNKAFKQARGKYIARMDADDVSLPDRIEKQVLFMESHPEIIACCGRARILGKKSGVRRVIPRRFSSYTAQRCAMLFSCDMIHPTMFLRNDAILENNLKYDEEQTCAQDYMLWVDLLSKGDIATVPSIILLYRIHEGQISQRKKDQQRNCAIRAQMKLYSNFGISLTKKETELNFDFVKSGYDNNKQEISALYDKIENEARKKTDRKVYKTIKRECSYRICKSCFKGAVRNHALSFVFWKRFWYSFFKVNYWGFYFRSMFG